MRHEVAGEEYVDEPQLSLEDQSNSLRADWQDILTDGSWTITDEEASEILGLAKGDLSTALDAMKSVSSNIRKRNFKITDFMPDEILGLVHKELADLGKAQEHMNVQPTQASEAQRESATGKQKSRYRHGRMSEAEVISGLQDAYRQRVKVDDQGISESEVTELLQICPSVGYSLQSFTNVGLKLMKGHICKPHHEILAEIKLCIEHELDKARKIREAKQAQQET